MRRIGLRFALLVEKFLYPRGVKAALPYCATDMAKIDALAHVRTDDVAVVIRDVRREEKLVVGFLDSPEVVYLTARSDIPLGHKIALKEIAAGQDVTEYGFAIGHATLQIAVGEHVHVHNLRSNRW